MTDLMTMDNIDPVSIEFMAWVDKKLSDPEYYHEFRKECVRRFQNYISRDPEVIKKALAAKLVRGSREHGSPARYTTQQVQEELEMEFLDIFGWRLVELFNEE